MDLHDSERAASSVNPSSSDEIHGPFCVETGDCSVEGGRWLPSASPPLPHSFLELPPDDATLCATESAAASETGTRNYRPPIDNLLATCHEDIACILPVLRELGCNAALRGIDGTILPLIAIGDARSNSPIGAGCPLSVPIYDADGEPMAFLDVSARDSHLTDQSQKLIRTLVERTVRAIAERWFRICHRRRWIVAALRDDEADTYIVLAADPDHRLVGADRQARQILKAAGRRFHFHLTLSAFFQDAAIFRRERQYCDVATTWRGTSNGALWSVLVTPPDHGITRLYGADYVLIHTRPRADRLTYSSNPSPNEKKPQGLPRWMVRLVQEYIDGHLETALKLEDLAAIVKLSVSHFVRAFHKSVGLAPHCYVMRCRLSRAQELLVKTNLTLADIALKTGFSDQSHFTNRFRKLMGLPPRAFRAQHREMKSLTMTTNASRANDRRIPP